MSFVYTFINYFPLYPQAVYTEYLLPTHQNSLHPSCFPNTQSQTPQTQNRQNSQPILPPTQTTCENLETPQGMARSLREKKQNKRKITKRKDQVFGRRKQNKQRNMMSFIFKGYIQYAFQERAMVKVIEQYSRKCSVDNGVSNFYEFMIAKFPNRKSYVGIRYIHELITKESSESAMSQILSLTLRLYLKQIYPMLIIRGPQTNKKQRLALLRKARTIAWILFKD